MFAVSLCDVGDGVLVDVAGEIDVLSAPRLRAAVHEAIDRAGTGTVVLDLGEVTFLDSSGVQALLDGYHSAMVAGGRMTVRGASGTAYRVLKIVGLTAIFGLTPHDSPPGDPLCRP